MPSLTIPARGGTLTASAVTDPTGATLTVSHNANWITGTNPLTVAANTTTNSRSATVNVTATTPVHADYDGQATATSAWTVTQEGYTPTSRTIAFEFSSWNLECDRIPVYFTTLQNPFDIYIDTDRTSGIVQYQSPSGLVDYTSNTINVASTSDNMLTYETSDMGSHVVTFYFHRDNMDVNSGLSLVPSSINEIAISTTCSSDKSVGWVGTYTVPAGNTNLTISLGSHNPNFIFSSCSTPGPTPTGGTATMTVSFKDMSDPVGFSLDVDWGSIEVGTFTQGNTQNSFTYTASDATSSKVLRLGNYSSGNRVYVEIVDENGNILVEAANETTLDSINQSTVPFSYIKNARWYLYDDL